jgi:hypothetical protein
MSLDRMDHQSNRRGSSVVSLIALIDCAVTGSWVAAFIAVMFGVVDVTLDRWLEIQAHREHGRNGEVTHD